MTKKKSPVPSLYEFDLPSDVMSTIGSESEEDLTGLTPERIGQTVVFATDWTADTIIGQLQKGNINLDPAFQRRDAWTVPRKSKFIESLVLGLPIPQIVLAESFEKKGKFIVIDGKQRLLSLQQFAGINLEEGTTPLTLNGLEILKRLNGKTYDDVSSDGRLHDYFTAFENQTIRTVIVRNWQTEETLYLIFHRLNTGSVPLSTQELRQALHPGPFLKFVASRSETSKAIQKVLGLEKPDFRMRDVELLVRYLAFRNRLSMYSGNLKKFLDDTCKDFNRQWANRNADIELQCQEFDAAIDITYLTFGESAFRKWDSNSSSYERRFNRAVFDIMTFYFSDPSLKERTQKNAAKIKSAFESLCSDNGEFRRSLETTTKSIEATSTRFRLWGNALKKVVGGSFEIPVLLATKKK
jgi:hypothetical protein